MTKASPVEVERRVEVTRLEILGAEDPSWIVPNLSMKFGVTERHVRNYMRAARKRIAESAQFAAVDMLAEHISIRRLIRKRSLDAGDNKTALAAAQDEAKLFNLYPAARHEVTLDWREEARKHGIQNPDAVLQQVIEAAVAGSDDGGGDAGDSAAEVSEEEAEAAD